MQVGGGGAGGQAEGWEKQPRFLGVSVEHPVNLQAFWCCQPFAVCVRALAKKVTTKIVSNR